MDTIKQLMRVIRSADRLRFCPGLTRYGLLTLLLVLHPLPAQASMFKGETLDKVSDVLAWVVLIIVPIVGIGAFWLVHILPEKIAEKKKHPQAKAIQVLCLLSLVFGGMLWPIAWLWAYSKPVLYKMAYGADTVDHEHGDKKEAVSTEDDALELQRLQTRLAELQTKLAVKPATDGGEV